ncbi:hypothetical protein BT69DRAFT_1356190 [Atractiella rhizophila]|nr:hypothetical protein BT69DRAFT_1356190 [Atractiella rhizophila]
MPAAPPSFQFAVSSSVSLSLTHFPALVATTHPKFALVAHPLGRLGGNQRDPVVAVARRTLTERGWDVVTFDSRGVGGSGGRGSFTGTDEGNDYQTLIDGYVIPKLSEAITKDPTAPKAELLLCGYSAGSLYSTYAFPSSSSTASIKIPLHIAHLLISYPLSVLWALTAFHASTFQSKLKDLVTRAKSKEGGETYKLMIIYGDRDEFTGVDKYRKWVEELEMKKDGRVKVVEVEDADHFWRGESGDRLESAIETWLEEGEKNPKL